MTISKALHRTGRWLVILFCLWHGAAVASYSLPPDANDPAMLLLRQKSMTLFRPYMLITSQWQQWNLFAPNPLRRVVRYVIQIRIGDTWKTVEVLDEHTIAWWRDADELKLLRRLEDGEDYWTPVRNRYLEDICAQKKIAGGTPIRLYYRYYVIPKDDFWMPMSWWQKWEREWNKRIGAKTVCPRQEVTFFRTAKSGNT